MKALFILNDPPYGTERVFNALRLAQALLKKEPQSEVTISLMADSVVADVQARAGWQRQNITVWNAHGCTWHR
jgi:sulfur relay (sulfurtransferase) complex TusBCD TusD component (DsrE family)